MRATASDGYDEAQDREPFALDGEPLLLINPADLVITKTVAPGLAAPGDALTYTVAFSNSGYVTATGVLITDAVPISVTNVSYVYAGATLTETGPFSYTWQVADLGVGQGGVITITGQLSATLPHGHVFTNTAVITSTQYDPEPLGNIRQRGGQH